MEFRCLCYVMALYCGQVAWLEGFSGSHANGLVFDVTERSAGLSRCGEMFAKQRDPVHHSILLTGPCCTEFSNESQGISSELDATWSSCDYAA